MQTVLPVNRLVGTTLGDYQIERLLNHGTLGTVYIATKNGQAQSTMITLFSLPDNFPEQAKKIFWTRFHQEGQKLIKLRHPHILPLHTYGQYASYPYIVSSFVKGRSLAQILKQQPLFTPQQTLNVLKQVAVGLDYIHNNGVVHGLLNPTSLLVDNFQTVQLGGIGLRPILEMYGIERSNHPYAHLYSIAETFLGAPEYLAPECARSAPVDARTDIYSLGIILFEMLTGKRPFSGSDKVEVVLQRLQGPIPSLRTVFPNAPVRLDRVIQKALQQQSSQRFQSVNELAQAFEQALQGEDVSEQIGARNAAHQPAAQHTDTTLPPTVDWFAEEMPVDISAHGVPTTTMSYLSSIEPASVRMPAQSRQSPEPSPEGHTMAFQRLSDSEKPPMAKVIGGDPFDMWAASSAKREAQPATKQKTQSQKTASVSPAKQQSQKTATASAGKQQSQPTASPSPAKKPTKTAPKPGRRKVVAMLTAGTVVAVAGLGFGGMSLARTLHQNQTTQTATTKKAPPAAQKSTPAAKQATKAPQAKTPTKSMQPATHTGTVIGATTLAKNSSKTFTNPADGNQSLLIHLASGTFVAGERACTHQGVPVNYNSATGKLVCPLHGSIFDPANNFAVLQGPATTPLKTVTIKVNSDGTITI